MNPMLPPNHLETTSLHGGRMHCPTVNHPAFARTLPAVNLAPRLSRPTAHAPRLGDRIVRGTPFD